MHEGDASRRRPSLTQRFFLRLMPGRAHEIERQSREWIDSCPHCGLDRTVWDVGGIRYKASSRGMHPVEHRPGSVPT
jgi:hypothetical protein